MGTPQTNSDGSIKTIENRNNTKWERNWEGAEEYNVNVDGASDTYRILKKQTGTDAAGNPTYKYGYTTDHYKTTIHEFTPKTTTK